MKIPTKLFTNFIPRKANKMKLSAYIKQLQAIEKQYGNLNVVYKSLRKMKDCQSMLFALIKSFWEFFVNQCDSEVSEYRDWFLFG